MTNYEKWAEEFGFKMPSKTSIICMNVRDCKECPIGKKFRICESDDGSREREIEEWLNEEVEG